VFKNLDSRRKKELLILLAVAGGALFLVLRARASASNSASSTTTNAATDPTGLTADPGASSDPYSYGTDSSYADNGEQAAALGDAVTQGLTGVQTALSGLTSQLQQQPQQPTSGALDTTAAPTSDPNTAAAIGALSDVATAAISQLGNGQKNNSASHPGAGKTAGGKTRPSKPAGGGNRGRTATTRPGSGTTKVSHHGSPSHANHAKAQPQHRRK
jgi:hypothetical protein